MNAGAGSYWFDSFRDAANTTISSVLPGSVGNNTGANGLSGKQRQLSEMKKKKKEEMKKIHNRYI